MNNRELAKAIIMSRSGVAKSADFVAAGIRAVDVVNMCMRDLSDADCGDNSFLLITAMW